MRKPIFILLFALLGVLSAQAYDFEVDGIYYNILSCTDQVEVTSGSVNYSGSVVIPATVMNEGATYSVTSIGTGAFLSCSSLISVTIPEGVTSIGGMAFYCCSGLTSMTIPESIDFIGTGAFYGCTSISAPLYNSQIFAYMPTDYEGEYSIPTGIQSIGGWAFNGCRSLTSVTIPESVTAIGDGAFLGCGGLTSVTSLARKPPYCEHDRYGGPFSDHSATLFVPRGCKEAYQTAEEWCEFTRIYENGFDGTGLVKARPNDTTMGRVTGGGDYEIGEEITLTAIPNEGYHFVKWDDDNTDNPRTLTVAYDITLTAIFADPTPNETPEEDNFRVYVQGRTINFSEDRGAVQVYNMAGQCVYNGHATAIPVPQSGVYIVAVGQQRFKVLVR